MDLYRRKQWWKISLSVTAILIVAASLFYSNSIVKLIAAEEREKARLWAEAVEERASLVKYTSELFDKLKLEERKKVELWASGFRKLISIDDPGADISFLFKVIENNETVPVILVNDKGEIVSHRNIKPEIAANKRLLAKEAKRMARIYSPIEITISEGKSNFLYYEDSNLLSELKSTMDNIIESFISEVVINSASVPVIFTDSTQTQIISTGNIPERISNRGDDALMEFFLEMKEDNVPIMIELNEGVKRYIYYKESVLLTQLKYYPVVQLVVIGAFLLISYFLFSTSRKAEQDRVWVGMSKETAHQLGTPISSMMAWVGMLQDQYPEDFAVRELNNDVKRLEIIAERFSKIGSSPILSHHNLHSFVHENISYLQKRVSKKVRISITPQNDPDIQANINLPLLGWVLENMVRNSVDAMDGEGQLSIHIFESTRFVGIEITDTGKGIPKHRFKTIFQPGFTTKKRGWGLGLTLVKRIIEEYHNGHIYVVDSVPEVSTKIRIELNR